MQERKDKFLNIFNQKRCSAEQRFCLYEQYQQKANEQFIVPQAVIRKNEKDHTEKQKLFEPDIAPENARKTAEYGVLMRFALTNGTFGFFFTFFLALLFLSAFFVLLGFTAFRRRLGAKTWKRRKRASAVIARQFYRNINARISVLS